MISLGTQLTLPDRINSALLMNTGKKRMNIYNLSSMFDFGIPLPALIPPYMNLTQEVKDDQRVFDEFYANYILTNDIAFYQMMNIMYSIYEDSELLVYILIGRDEYRDMITESLVKFIQQRYGYNCNIINEANDWPYVADSSINIYGLYNFDIDKERYITIKGVLEPGYIPKVDPKEAI